MSESIFKKAAKRFKSIFSKGTKVHAVRDRDAEDELRRLTSLPITGYGYPEGERSYEKQVADLNKKKQTMRDLLPKVSPDVQRDLGPRVDFQIRHIDQHIAPLQRNIDRREAQEIQRAESRRIKAEKEAADKFTTFPFQSYTLRDYKNHYR
jgi:hypothetical protein